MKLSTRLVLLILGCLLPILTAQIYSQINLYAERPRRSGYASWRLASKLADEQLAARRFERHDEFVVALESFAGIFCHGPDESVACGWGNFRRDLVRWT